MSVWLQEGSEEALVDSSAQSFTPARAGQDPGEGGHGLKETASEIPSGVWKAPDFLGWAGCATPSVLLGFGSVIFSLARVPQQQGDPDGGESHDPEGCPVQLWKTTEALLRLWSRARERTRKESPMRKGAAQPKF